MPNQFCTQCGASISADSKFCTACGAEVQEPAEKATPQVAKTPVVPLAQTRTQGRSIEPREIMSAAGRLMGNTTMAAAVPGEMSFTQAMPVIGGVVPEAGIGPLRYLFASGGRIMKGMAGLFKNKKRLLAVIVLSLIWLLLLILPALGVNASVLRYLSFLTFAQGGAGGSYLSMVGGIIGKGVFAYFIAALFTGGKPLPGMGSGLKILLGAFAAKDKRSLSVLLLGIGLALIGYNFITGNASLQNSMAGIAAFLISLRALTQKTGFLRGFLQALFNKKGSMPDTSRITRIMAGWTAGFALGIPLSSTGISMIGYAVGIVLILASIVLSILSGSKKEVVAG